MTIPVDYVTAGANIPSILGAYQSKAQVFRRALDELTQESIDTVLELIAAKSLYRGEDHKTVLQHFQRHKAAYASLTDDHLRDYYVWTAITSKNIFDSVISIRNTSIGTLLVDLSDGVDLERAVASFESKVAPTNYKRPTALVTKGMIESAKKTIAELGLESALQRRHATIDDITINNILFADSAARTVMTGETNVFDELSATKAVKRKANDNIETVSIDTFVKDILPLAKSIEVLFENKHVNNLVSLIAPSDPTAEKLFKWDNKFSWSYAGELADSNIKERVKKAGGNVTGVVCCRLAWNNYDDLDFHMIEPNKYEIYFGNRNSTSPCGGRLDVDMNAGHGTTRTPVENIFYESAAKMKIGTYKLNVHQFCQRERTNVGFEVEIDLNGELYTFAYDKPVNGTVTVAEIIFDGKSFRLGNCMKHTKVSREAWNLHTENFQKVDVVMNSPNFWDDNGVGNKHFFFMLNGCANPDAARGFYNEFLRTDLDKHRKVMEIVGSKLRTVPADKQLSGLGFSTTIKNELVCRVTGTYTRTVKIVFGN